MSSFAGQARRVRDERLPLPVRVLALRECVLHFAPYGFRDTWHHLILSAGIPLVLEDDPGSLIRAVDELEEARARWLAAEAEYRARRRSEDAARIPRQPAVDFGHTLPHHSAGRPVTTGRPHDRLVVVTERLIAAYHSTGPAPAVCPACGMAGRSRATGPARPWQLIWLRAVERAGTVGGGDIHHLRVEFTPTSGGGRAGQFLLYVRGELFGDGSPTAPEPQLRRLRPLWAVAGRPGSQLPEPLDLGGPFAYLDVTAETTAEDLILTFTTRPDRPDPPRWARPPGLPWRLRVRRREVLDAWRTAKPHFRALLRSAGAEPCG